VGMKLNNKTIELPEHWEVSRIGNICSKPQYGWTTKANFNDGTIRLLRTTDITSGSINWETVPYCSEAPEDIDKYLIKKGDILISRAGSIGVSHLIKDEKIAVFASYLIRFKPYKELNEKYVYFFLKSPFYWEAIGSSKVGVAVPNVNATKLSRIEIPISPKKEQDHIVAEIEKQFSRLDEAVENLKRVKANLKRYKAAVLKAAVEGKLTEEWRAENPDVEPASQILERILTERRKKWEEAELTKMKAKGKKPRDDKWKKKYKKPASPSVAELNSLPDDWVWVTVEQIASPEPNAITDGPFGSNLKTKHYTHKGPRVIRLQNIGNAEFIDEKSHISEKHYESLIKHSVVFGDVIIAALGRPAPRACLIPSWIGKAIVKADCIRWRASPYIDSGYVMYALNSEPVQKKTEGIVHGVGRPRLNLGEIKGLPIPLPAEHEQKEIVNEIEYRLSVSQEIMEQVEINLNRAERLRQSILKKAFSGRLIFQDENDKPMANIME